MSANLAQLHPIVQAKAQALIAAWLRDHGKPLHVASVFRTPDEQLALYQIGRRGVPGEETVTGLRFGYHNVGCALDVCPAELITVKNWAPYSPLWDALGVAGEAVGLHWGGRFKTRRDLPHFELRPVAPLAEIRAAYVRTGAVPELAFAP